LLGRDAERDAAASAVRAVARVASSRSSSRLARLTPRRFLPHHPASAMSMDRRAFLNTMGVGILATPLVAEAQETRKVPRIGFLGSPSSPFVEAFRRGLRELGYVEQHNIVVEYRWATDLDKLPALTADLVRLKVDIIVASSQAAVAAKQATSEIPIVTPIITDPVRLGLVASLAKPGGNVTGFATQNEELPGKWLELVKEALPKVSNVAVLVQPTYDGGAQLKATESAAQSLGVHLLALKAESPGDLVTVLGEGKKNRAEALIVSSSPLFYLN